MRTANECFDSWQEAADFCFKLDGITRTEELPNGTWMVSYIEYAEDWMCAPKKNNLHVRRDKAGAHNGRDRTHSL
mgnify:CR=1 FL=1